ncbi:MAG: alpha/beta hydrolase [Oligoflexia bacterium]|nr:alpha/beta hydrolase [Oligoflexia bacterium]
MIQEILSEKWLWILAALIIIFMFFTMGGWTLAYFYRKRLMRQYAHDGLKIPGPQSKHLMIDNIQLHYVVEGSGPDIFLIHGIGANLYCWRFLIPLLARSFRVWAIDLKGYGLSDKPRKSSYGLAAQAKLLIEFLKAQNVQQCILVGNSMGGAIAAEMTIQNPDLIKDLVLINSAHDPKIIGPLDLRKIRLFIDLLPPLFINKVVVKQFMKTLYGKQRDITDEVVSAYISPFMASDDTHHAFVASFEALIDKTLIPRFKALNKRVLILCGQNDRLVPVRYGQQLHQSLAESLFHIHPDAGHHLQEEDPQWIVDKIKEFISNSKI